MKPGHSAILLRLCCLLGAAIDAVAGVMMLVPDVWASFYDLPGFVPGMEISRALAMGAVLMLGWTVLLLWAAIKPVERKGVLLITVFPVIVGMMLGTVEQIVRWGAPVTAQLPTLVMQLCLCALFLYAYATARGDKQ